MPRAEAQSTMPGHDRAGLGHERELAGLGGQMPERGVEAAARHHDPEAVGADDPQEMRPRRLEHRLLERLSALGAALAKACCDDDRRLGTPLAESGNDAGDRLRRRRHHGEIRRRRQARDVRMTWLAVDLRVLRIDQHDRAGKAPFAQVPLHDGPNRRRLIARANQRHRCRLEQAIQITHRHALILPAGQAA